MPETLKVGGEKTAENIEASGLEVLTEMDNEFNPAQAKARAESDKATSAERSSSGQSEAVDKARSGVLATLSGEREKELSPEDAANEYLSLLDELSQDFANPYYGDERKEGRGHHYAHNITTELGQKYSDNPHYRWRGYAGTEAGETDGTMLRIANADAILASEIGWREEGEKGDEQAKKIAQIDQAVTDLDSEYASKGRLGKFIGRKKYEQTKNRLESQKTMVTRRNRDYNNALADELAYAYDETGGYGSKGIAGKQMYNAEHNEDFNRRFFGLGDPERAEKVERAIELRQKYAAEWAQDTPPQKSSSESEPRGNVSEQTNDHEDIDLPEFLSEIDDTRRREIVDVSANLSEKIPESMIMGGNALRILYEARTGNRMFGVGKNDHDIYVPVAKAHEFMEQPPEGYVVKHELDEQGQEKWVHPERDYVVISEMGSDGKPHEHIDVFGKDGQEYTEVELDGKGIRVQSLTSQIADKIDMYIETERFNKVDEDPSHGPTTRDKNGVYAQRMLELVDVAPDEVDESKLPENWRELLTAIAAEGKYGVSPDETPEEKAAREKAINEKIELKRRREQAKNDFIAALGNYFTENHDLAEPTELPSELASPLAGYEEAVNNQLKAASSANAFMQGIMSDIGPDATKKVVERITKDII